jgi:hypothetical protein
MKTLLCPLLVAAALMLAASAHAQTVTLNGHIGAAATSRGQSRVFMAWVGR